jgi:hypothetical protein
LLAPDIVEAILNGTQPPTLQLSDLERPFPIDWEEQRTAFGFSPKPSPQPPLSNANGLKSKNVKPRPSTCGLRQSGIGFSMATGTAIAMLSRHFGVLSTHRSRSATKSVGRPEGRSARVPARHGHAGGMREGNEVESTVIMLETVGQRLSNH